MKSSFRKYIAAGVLASAIGIGGAAVASAAVPDDSTDTVVPAVTSDESTSTAETPATDTSNCEGRDGQGETPATPAPAASSETVDTSGV
jgi:hypothetical protein